MKDERKKRLKEVLERRTKGIVLVLENLYHPHNLSAVIRSAEAFGIQYVYVVGQTPEELNKTISLGTEKWIDLIYYNNSLELIKELKSRGYRIAATMPSSTGIDPSEYREEKEIALFMGNEKDGLSEDVIKNAEIVFTIPLYGFVKSLNVSVAASICLYSLTKNEFLRNRGLEESEKNRLLNLWALKSVRNSELHLQEVLKRKTPSFKRGS